MTEMVLSLYFVKEIYMIDRDPCLKKIYNMHNVGGSEWEGVGKPRGVHNIFFVICVFHIFGYLEGPPPTHFAEFWPKSLKFSTPSLMEFDTIERSIGFLYIFIH